MEELYGQGLDFFISNDRKKIVKNSTNKGGIKMVTYGDFVDSIEKTEYVGAQFFIQEWKKTATEEEWKRFRPAPLTLDLVMDFVDDAVMFFQERLAGTCTEEVYSDVKKEARDFLQEICKKAAEFGITIDPAKFLPLTPTEAISQTSCQTSTSGS